MKKFISIVLAMLILCVLPLSCFAAAPTADGSYTVPIELKHAEKDKTSFGNSYLASPALLEIENGEKYITIGLAKSVAGLSFSYYTDGSLEGETAAAEELSNVQIGDQTYDKAYKFPVVSDGEYIGLTFSAAIMPMSPSARLFIDYDSATALSTEAPAETTAATTATEAATTAATTAVSEEATTEAATTEATTAATTAAETTTAAPTTAATTAAATTTAATTAAQAAATAASTQITVKVQPAGIVTVLLALAAILAVVYIIIAAKNKETRPHD